jgi:hypothetical protein
MGPNYAVASHHSRLNQKKKNKLRASKLTAHLEHHPHLCHHPETEAQRPSDCKLTLSKENPNLPFFPSQSLTRTLLFTHHKLSETLDCLDGENGQRRATIAFKTSKLVVALRRQYVCSEDIFLCFM